MSRKAIAVTTVALSVAVTTVAFVRLWQGGRPRGPIPPVYRMAFWSHLCNRLRTHVSETGTYPASVDSLTADLVTYWVRRESVVYLGDLIEAEGCRREEPSTSPCLIVAFERHAVEGRRCVVLDGVWGMLSDHELRSYVTSLRDAAAEGALKHVKKGYMTRLEKSTGF